MFVFNYLFLSGLTETITITNDGIPGAFISPEEGIPRFHCVSKCSEEASVVCQFNAQLACILLRVQYCR